MPYVACLSYLFSPVFLSFFLKMCLIGEKWRRGKEMARDEKGRGNSKCVIFSAFLFFFAEIGEESAEGLR